ncbi:DUF3080 family protein [Photobacterium damselae subsp. piscicida]|nr:DUF3080 family protein [Photobacterium damselae subsp. piscicida]
MESPPFSTYAQRLANVPETSFDEQTVNTHLDIIPYPDNRDIYQTIPDIRIGLLDAYELRQCGLFHLIAERNSVLGKVQDKTRQLQYEILFLQGLRTCLATLDTNTDSVPTTCEHRATKATANPSIFMEHALYW